MIQGMIADSDQRGVTLTELLVTLSLMALILTLVTAIFSEGIKSYSRDIAEVGTQLDLRFVGEKLRREIRTSHSGFYSDKEYPYTEEKKLYLLAGDKLHPEIIIYSFQDGALLRNAEGNSERLLEKVEDVELYIADSSGPPIVEMKIVYKEHPTHQLNPITKQWNLHVMPRFSVN